MIGGRKQLRKLKGILFDFAKKKKEEGIIDSSDKETVAEGRKAGCKKHWASCFDRSSL